MNIFRKLLCTSTALSILMASAVTQGQTSADLVQGSLDSGDRPSADAVDDARRMPLEVLAFAADPGQRRKRYGTMLSGEPGSMHR